jgi:hypothetical protein
MTMADRLRADDLPALCDRDAICELPIRCCGWHDDVDVTIDGEWLLAERHATLLGNAPV